MNARNDFLQARLSGIGGSDCASVLGLNPYKTALQLYLEKRGEIEPDNLDDKESVIVGRDLENYVAQRYSDRTGLRVERYTQQIRHPQYEFMIANVDRLVSQHGKRPQYQGQIRTRHGLECKTALGRFTNKADWGEEGTDQVPMPYLFQCQHYMAVCDADVWDLAVLMAGPELRIYTLERDDELIREIIDGEATFWGQVQSGQPPVMDHTHRAALDLLAKMYPGINGQTLQGTTELQQWFDVMQQAKDRIKDYTDVADGAKAHLLEMMGECAVLELPGGMNFTRKLVERKGFTVEPTSYIDARVSKRKETN